MTSITMYGNVTFQMGRSAARLKQQPPPQQALFGAAPATLAPPPLPTECLAYLFQKNVLGNPHKPCSGTRVELQVLSTDTHKGMISHQGAADKSGLRHLQTVQSASDVYRALVHYWHAAVKPDSVILYNDPAADTDNLLQISWRDFAVYSKYQEKTPKDIEAKWRHLVCGMTCGQKTHPIAAIIPTHQGIEPSEEDGRIVYDMQLSYPIDVVAGGQEDAAIRLSLSPEWRVRPQSDQDILFVGFPSLYRNTDTNQTIIMLEPNSPDMIRLVGARSVHSSLSSSLTP